MRSADYIVQRLVDQGIDTTFMLTGGGAMHLNDAFARHPEMRVVCLHHEQALAIAAESYARATNKVAAVNVTTGPGGINALNGVYGAFVDSVPMVIVSGQVRTETVAALNDRSLRQLGDQEVDIFRAAQPIVKYIAMPTTTKQVEVSMDRALQIMLDGRGGPVWIDVPINIQSRQMGADSDTEPSELIEYYHPNSLLEREAMDPAVVANEIASKIANAKRPLVLAGSGIHFSNQEMAFLEFLDQSGLPAVTGWNAHDLLPSNHRANSGKPGTVGDRAGNFATRNCDFLLILGCRMNIRQVSYNWASLAPNASRIMVDIDPAELRKPTLDLEVGYCLDLKDLMPALNKAFRGCTVPEAHSVFRDHCVNLNKRYPVVTQDQLHQEAGGKLNPYGFFKAFFDSCREEEIVVLGNGSACVIGLQAASIKQGMRVYTNSGCASMGYDIPAAIGACLRSTEKPGRTLCVTGDGSIMMNLQELATISFQQLPVKIFVIDNSGYHSIRQTQTNYFADNRVGTCSNDGLGFPDFARLASGFGIRASVLSTMDDMAELAQSVEFNDMEPHLFVVPVDENQTFSPKLQSRKLADGSMVSPELHDMFPFLSAEEMQKNIID